MKWQRIFAGKNKKNISECYNGNFTSTKHLLKRRQLIRTFARILYLILREVYVFNNCKNHLNEASFTNIQIIMIYEAINIKQAILQI